MKEKKVVVKYREGSIWRFAYLVREGPKVFTLVNVKGEELLIPAEDCQLMLTEEK